MAGTVSQALENVPGDTENKRDRSQPSDDGNTCR
jgi:hypothetical protein